VISSLAEANLLEPVADAIGRHVLDASVIFASSTPVRLVEPATPPIGCGRLWAYSRDERPWSGQAPPAVWYRFCNVRRGRHPIDHLAHYRGWIYADGHAGCDAHGHSVSFREIACMEQVRREFLAIQDSHHAALTAEATDRITQILAAEAPLYGTTPNHRAEHRQRSIAPLIDDLEVWLAMQLTAVPTKSAVAAAIRFALVRLARLRPYLEDGRLDLTNIAREYTSHADFGEDSFWTVSTASAGAATAVICTLIETARINDVDPFGWLAAISELLSSSGSASLDELLPWQWKPSQ